MNAVASAEIVVIGGSAGSLEVLDVVLPALPASFPLPVVVVVHVVPDRDSLLAPLFAAKCALRVTEAMHGAPLAPGIVFAPPDYHLAVEPDRTLSLALDPPLHFSRPAIDVLFESAAWWCGQAVIGVVLSGANEDGARGLRRISRAGGRAWVQDPVTALARTMPDAALRAVGNPAVILAPTGIAHGLSTVTHAGSEP